jgi:hypothetical protein
MKRNFHGQFLKRLFFPRERIDPPWRTAAFEYCLGNPLPQSNGEFLMRNRIWKSKMKSLWSVLPFLALVFNPITPACAQPQPEGLVALYTFKEGSGTSVNDVSGVGTPMNLTIGNAAAVEWLPDGGILIKQDVLIATPSAATKFIEAAMQANELTVEAYVKPANLTQGGPARMVTLSLDAGARNATLGQQEGTWAMRTRTQDTGNNGSGGPGQFTSGPETVGLRLHHVVFTRDESGIETFYIDGVALDSRFVCCDFTGWATNYRFALGGEFNTQRFWHGEMHKVAIYSRALTAQEVGDLADELMPKVEIADLSPSRGAHFHSAQTGITFRAVALADNTIAQSDIKLTLNGEDRSGQLQITGSNKNWQVALSGLEPNQAYAGEITVTDNAGRTSIAVLQFETYELRQDGLVALYTFEEGNGSIIQDRSESGPPLDLAIGEPSNVRWMPGGGLAIETFTRIASSVPATKIFQPIEQSNALTVEAWIRSAGPQSGPARIVSASLFRGNFPGSELDNSLRNFTLGQEENTYSFHLRSTETDIAGRPPLVTPEVLVEAPTHVVFTRDANGQARLFVDGEQVAGETVGGDFSNWIEGYFLGLGTELNEMSQAPAEHRSRQWLGEFYRVALYNRALSEADVLASFNDFGGNDTTAPTTPQNVAATAGAVFVHLSWEGSTDDSGRVAYEVERNGQLIAPFITEPQFLDQSVSPTTSYTYAVRAVDFSRNRSALSASVAVTTKGLSQVTGQVKAEFYTGIMGVKVNDLFSDFKFPDDPDVTLFLPAFESPSGWGDNYGVRITGWFLPPQTGRYVFFLAADDEGEFRLSIDATAANLKLIAHEPVWHPFRDWLGTSVRRDAFGPENRSDTFSWTEWPVWDVNLGQPLIELQAGQRYYFEGLMKEGGGGDHIGVTFKLQGEPDPASGTPSRMRGSVIQTIGDPDFVQPIIQSHPQGQAVALGASVTLNVTVDEISSAPFSYQWQFDGVNIAGATGATYTIPSFQAGHVGNYAVAVSNLAGTITSDTAFVREAGSGLLALYLFDEGSGTTVRDVSNAGTPLDLQIGDAGAVRWLPDGGLALDSNVLIASPGPAAKVIQGIKASNEMSVEAWVKPGNLTQEGPARILTISTTTSDRNYTMGQQFDEWQIRRRTSITDNNAGPAEHRIGPGLGGVDLRLIHLVYTRDASGLDTLYQDGVALGTNLQGGDFSNWNDSYRLGLGRELDLQRPWLGEMHRMAIYNRALTAAEVAQSFQAGPRASGPGREGFVLVSDFDLGQLGDLNGQLGWTANGAVIVADPADPNNQVAGFLGGSGDRGSYLPALIPAGQTGTLFFRLRVDTDNSDLTTPVLNWSVGMSHVALTGNGGFGDFQAQLNQNRDAGNSLPEEMRIRDAGAFVSLTPLQAEVWYNVWMVMDNSADATQVYVQGGQFPEQTLLQAADGKTSFVFRNSGGGPLGQDLIRFFVRLAGSHAGHLYLDDIWLDSAGVTLDNPVGGTVAPLALGITRLQDQVVLSWPAAGSADFILETTPSLSAPNWTPVPDEPGISGDRKTVSITPGNSAGFYRLRQP